MCYTKLSCLLERSALDQVQLERALLVGVQVPFEAVEHMLVGVGEEPSGA